jgi:carboxyl-terminal processing protease
MRTLALILLFMAVPLAGGELKPVQEADFWQGTGLDRALALKIINNQNCTSSELHFQACRRALIDGSYLTGLQREKRFQALYRLKFQRKVDFESDLTAILTAETTLPQEMVIGKTISAYMRALDPYAKMMPATFVELLLNGQSKTYYGLGIETMESAAGLIVFQVYPHSPASKAGLKIHDRIVSINGISARDEFEAHTLGQMLSGKTGDQFILEVESGGKRSQLKLAVAALDIPESNGEVFSEGGKNIAYYRMRSFAVNSCLNLQRGIEAWQRQLNGQLNGLILDLRHNSGGLLKEGKCIAQLFAGDRSIVTREPLQLEFPEALKIEKANSLDTNGFFGRRTAFKNLPLVVLIDERSASASEIVAGALQDYKAAWIVGERSYGKGTTQLIHRLQDFPKLRVLKTVSRYLRPSGLSTQSVGVTPDFIVPFRKNASSRERRFVREENIARPLRLQTEPAWIETRPVEKSVIERCLSRQKSNAEDDHQLEIGVQIFSCLSETDQRPESSAVE